MPDSPQPDAPQAVPHPPGTTTGTSQLGFYVWVEEDAFRATALVGVDDPQERETLLSAGRIVHRLILETTRANGATPGAPSVVRTQMAAIGADLRYLQGYCNKVARMDFTTTLDPQDHALAMCAMELGVKLHDMRNEVRERLSPSSPPPETPEHS